MSAKNKKALVYILSAGLVLCSLGLSAVCFAQNVSKSKTDENIVFLQKYGWDVSEEPFEEVYLTLPETFDAVYQRYNRIQRSQGFDLEKYKGKNIKKSVYEVYNFPGYENDSTVRATVYSHNGKIIAADICSVRIDGFMYGVKNYVDSKNEN